MDRKICLFSLFGTPAPLLHIILFVSDEDVHELFNLPTSPLRYALWRSLQSPLELARQQWQTASCRRRKLSQASRRRLSTCPLKVSEQCRSSCGHMSTLEWTAQQLETFQECPWHTKRSSWNWNSDCFSRWAQVEDGNPSRIDYTCLC